MGLAYAAAHTIMFWGKWILLGFIGIITILLLLILSGPKNNKEYKK